MRNISFMSAWRCIVLCALLLAVTAPARAAAPCEWAEPGADPFRGSRPLAILTMPGLSLGERLRLLLASASAPHDRALIWSDVITSTTGRLLIEPQLRDMSFGRKGRTCDITRATWPLGRAEPASVWRSGGVCLVVPDVCGNPSWAPCAPAPRYVDGLPMQRVPEPGTGWLVAAALGAVALIRRRSRPCQTA